MILKKFKRKVKNRRHNQKKKKLRFRHKTHSAHLAALWQKRFEKRTEKRKSKKYLQRVKEKLRQNNVPKPGYGLVYMKFGRRSFHLGFSKKKKIKNKSKFASKKAKKKGYALKIKRTIGQLQMYKGRARSSAVARKALASLFVKDLIKRRVHIVNIHLKSEMGKHYFAVIGALAQQNLVIRSVTRLINRPHGYVRKKKQRRT